MVSLADKTPERSSLAYKSPSPRIRKTATLSRVLACRVRKTHMGNSTQSRSVRAAVPTFV